MRAEPILGRRKMVGTYLSPVFWLILWSLAVGLSSVEAQERVRKAKAKERASRLEVVAVVEAYKIGAMEDFFEDGRIVSCDATLLRILTPEEFGETLIIYHNRPCPKNSPWRAESKPLRFLIDTEMLHASNVQIFDGAVSKLELIEKKGAETENRKARCGEESLPSSSGDDEETNLFKDGRKQGSRPLTADPGMRRKPPRARRLPRRKLHRRTRPRACQGAPSQAD